MMYKRVKVKIVSSVLFICAGNRLITTSGGSCMTLTRRDITTTMSQGRRQSGRDRPMLMSSVSPSCRSTPWLMKHHFNVANLKVFSFYFELVILIISELVLLIAIKLLRNKAVSQLFCVHPIEGMRFI